MAVVNGSAPSRVPWSLRMTDGERMAASILTVVTMVFSNVEERWRHHYEAFGRTYMTSPARACTNEPGRDVYRYHTVRGRSVRNGRTQSIDQRPN
jgi:hypothetical protein